MAVALIQGAFTVGEVAPALFGRFDLARMHVAATTMRNMFVRSQGGASSRAGTAVVGYSKQTGRNRPPRLIPFQFRVDQGLQLEFGNFYMRVVLNGAFVLEEPWSITAAAPTNPCALTVAQTALIESAVANNGAVSASYAPGDQITLAVGVGSQVAPAVLQVVTTQLISVALVDGGQFYGVGEIVTLHGGTATTRATIQVDTVDGGGAILTFHIVQGGTYIANPQGGTFTQFSASGVGSQATFDSALMAPRTMSVVFGGIYTLVPPNPVAQASTTGTGLGVTFNVAAHAVGPLADGDWVRIGDVEGMTELNGRTFVIRNVTPTSFDLYDVYGNPIDATAYTAYISGGLAARVFTLETPYSDADLDFIKFTQSADVMTLCCVNQNTLVEYPALDLARGASNTAWTLEPIVSQSPIGPPTNATVTTSSAGTTTYNYVVTAVDSASGAESIASNIAAVSLAVDIAGTAGTNTITWNRVIGAQQYNIYKATPGYDSATIPVGVLFGYAGTAYGVQFIDVNIIADFSQVPPQRRDPFAPGQVTGLTIHNGGAGYTTVGFTITTATGSGAVLQGVLVAGALAAVIVQDPGHNYSPLDTVAVTGDGAGALASILVGPLSGTYPAVPAYFQQRRVYGYTINQPDTYFMSQPGAFKNFDFRIPTIASDAITGSPWSVQVNGIQAMVNMPGGLVVFTGKEAWQLTGTGGSSLNPQPIAPTSQQAQPQAFNGCHITIPPIKIDYDILYVQAKGSAVRDLSYTFAQNIYTGADLTLNSPHLFVGRELREWAYAEEPFKIVATVSQDGRIMLTLTFVKPQEVAGWARHDTNGLFWSVSSNSERAQSNPALLVDALYVATERFIGGTPAFTGIPTYFIERFDDRLWQVVEDAWCVDCALALPQPQPDATLRASINESSYGFIQGFTDLVGGANYSAGTTGVIVDDNGQGDGHDAAVQLTIVGGVITAITMLNQGAGYSYPRIDFYDPANTGSGASATAILRRPVGFVASAAVFAPGDVGSVIRMGGGAVTITQYISSTVVIGDATAPITALFTDNSEIIPYLAPPGHWTMTAPVSEISGLWHLVGMEVTGLYDGHVLPPVVVPDSGTIPLPAPATAVVIGLGFECQIQTPYIDLPGAVTIQGQRKKIGELTVRLEASRGVEAGTNQPDGSTLSPPQIAPEWLDMMPIEDKGRPPYGSTIVPLYTGDTRLPVIGGFDVHGQVALRQRLPLPFNLLGVMPEMWPGDVPETDEPRQRQQAQQ